MIGLIGVVWASPYRKRFSALGKNSSFQFKYNFSKENTSLVVCLDGIVDKASMTSYPCLLLYNCMGNVLMADYAAKRCRILIKCLFKQKQISSSVCLRFYTKRFLGKLHFNLPTYPDPYLDSLLLYGDSVSGR